MKEKLNELKNKAKKLESLQENCNHEWNEPVEDIMKENITIPAWRGKDFYEKIIATRDVQCWSSTCKICGKKEYLREKNELERKTK